MDKIPDLLDRRGQFDRHGHAEPLATWQDSAERGAEAKGRRSPPQPLAEPEPILKPRDIECLGVLRLEVDATDVERRIFQVREWIEVSGLQRLTLLYPKWLPGYHSPQAPIELLAGLRISASGKDVPWRRHPVEVHAFHVDVPDGCDTIEVSFQFLSPTNSSQGRVVVSPNLLNLEWNTVVLYPAGHFARRITVEPRLEVPAGWQLGCALEVASTENGVTRFAPVPLDVLVYSPVLAGRHFRRIDLDEAGAVRLDLVADRAELLEATEAMIEPHRELVRQADRLFGARHFDHFDILLALSEEIGWTGVEHHRSCEAASIPGYFRDWDSSFVRRDTIPHEYVHSWNGKYRRGADSWTPCFNHPIQNSLMWVYEGQTQYWDRVLCARSGLWTKDQVLQALAETAAIHQNQAGSRWRALSDTTRDPIIASRSPLPWPSWQRSEDYYSEGMLIWLDVDTRLRELSGEERSLDDFARAFFSKEDGVWTTNTYTFGEVADTLGTIAPFDWAGFFNDKLHRTTAGAPLEGLERGGYRLVYRDRPTEFESCKEALSGITSVLFSIGLTVSANGLIQEVLWDSPVFHAGVIAGSQIAGVRGRPYSPDELKQAIARASGGQPVELLVRSGKRDRHVAIACPQGLRHPHLEPIAGARLRLDRILGPLQPR